MNDVAEARAVHPAPSDPADDDLAIARRIAGGDRPAFTALMRRHNRRLYRLARATLRDDAEAEDALQEAYLAAYRAMDRFRGEASLSTWLARMVLNECFGRLRRTRRRQNVIPIESFDVDDGHEAAAIDETPDARPEVALERSEMRNLLERKLDALPEDFRAVFVLRAVEELSVEETAACLDIPAATVRTRHFRARSLLREALAREIDVAERDLYEFGGARCDRIVSAVWSELDRH